MFVFSQQSFHLVLPCHGAALEQKNSPTITILPNAEFERSSVRVFISRFIEASHRSPHRLVEPRRAAVYIAPPNQLPLPSNCSLCNRNVYRETLAANAIYARRRAFCLFFSFPRTAGSAATADARRRAPSGYFCKEKTMARHCLSGINAGKGACV